VNDRRRTAEDCMAAQRIDKWLWCARIFKSRTLAAEFAGGGGVRLTRAGMTARVEKASAMVRPGDRMAFLLGDRMRVLEVKACAVRRGPAAEARLLYDDLSPPKSAAPNAGDRAKGLGRPTKKERRAIDRLTG